MPLVARDVRERSWIGHWDFDVHVADLRLMLDLLG